MDLSLISSSEFISPWTPARFFSVYCEILAMDSLHFKRPPVVFMLEAIVWDPIGVKKF